MAEWFKARAWKARVPKPYRGFESLSLRHFQIALWREGCGQSRIPTPIIMRIAAEVRKSIANGMEA